jgi:hypothetical protein
MGKYLPGKAWALVLRSGILPGVHLSIGILTSFYEVFTTMATGALLATILFAVQIRDFTNALDWSELRDLFARDRVSTEPIDPKVPLLMSLGLTCLLGVLILPRVFNRVAHRIAVPFRDRHAAALPQLPLSALARGPLLTAGCWILMGLSLWAVLQAVMTPPPNLSLAHWIRLTAYCGLAYVGTFIIFWIPSALGVREFFLLLLLTPEINGLCDHDEARAKVIAVSAVFLLRVVWMAAEVVFAGLIYWLPAGASTNAAAVAQERGPRSTDSY